MGNKTKQRFVELNVDEVSIVDSPANEESFMVLKCLNPDKEDSQMAKEIKKNEDVQEPNTENVEKVAVKIESPENDAVKKAMAHVSEMVENIAKSFKVEETKKDEPKDDSEEIKNSEKSSEIKKSDEPKDESESEDESVSKTIDGLIVGLQKAKSFTPSREAALKAALETLNNLAKELGMKEIATGGMPQTTVPKGTMFGDSGVKVLTKSLEDLTNTLKESLENIKETTKSLNERVEKIEKTRNPSQALDNDNEINGQKVEKSLWNGVL